MARDKVRNGAGGKECRFLSLSALRYLNWEGDYSSRIREWGKVEGRRRLQLEVALDEFAEFFAVFIAHVDEFDAAAVGADVADHGGEIELAETGADLQLDRIADSESSRGL